MASESDNSLSDLNREFDERYRELVREYLHRRSQLDKGEGVNPELPSFLRPNWPNWPSSPRDQHLQMMLLTRQIDAAKAYLNSLLSTDITTKLKLGTFLVKVGRKIGHLFWVWVIIAGIVCLSSLFLKSKFGLNAGEGGDNLYMAWMAFTTVGYGDVSPDGLISRAIVTLLALLGILTVGLVVTVLWNAAVESA